MHSISYLLAAVIALVPYQATAKIPPLSQDELVSQADLVIEGRILSIQKKGAVTHDQCYGWQNYYAQVSLEKLIKGKPDTMEITLTYKTRVQDIKDCVGGDDSYSFTPGTRHKMHLQATIDGGKTVYHFFNWAGLQDLP